MKRLKFLYRCHLMIALLLLICHADAVAADLPETFRVTRIIIDGAHHLKKKKIKSALTVVPPSKWRIWVKPPTAAEEDIEDDADSIAQFYKSVGYYHVDVAYVVDITDASADRTPSARVTYTIEEGAPVVVESIEIDSEAAASPMPMEDLLESIPLQIGLPFEEESYRKSRQLLQRQFGGQGYPFAEVTEKALIYPATNSAEVTYSVNPGKLCYFGDTTVTEGKSVINEKVLQRARTYHPGEVYDVFEVETSQRNLYNLDIFSAAVLQPGSPDPESGRVPMFLELRPKKKKSVKLGVGYGAEDGVRLKAGWTYRNPKGRGGKFYLEAQRTDLLNKSLVGYSHPYFWDSRSALLTESGILEEFLDSYESRKLFGTVRLTRSFGEDYNATIAYLLEYNELKDLNLSDPEELAAYQEDNTFFTSSVFGEFIRDTTDSSTNPKKGSTITFSVEIASKLLGSGLTYFKPSLELSKYVELPLDMVLGARIKFESISDLEQNEDIPIFKRLFLGGARTVRGYDFQKLGPLDATGNPEGGQSTALANIELRRPIIGILSGVLFLDMGMVDEDSFQYNEEVRFSAGAGLRVGTPVGPLRLDFGYKLNPQPPPPGMDPEDIEEESRWRIHFDIGHAF